jgi:polysaccharide export outer membrane protein
MKHRTRSVPKLTLSDIAVLVGLLCLASVLYRLSAATTDGRAAYVLGPDDSISVRAVLVPEFPDRPIRIESDGTINLPLVGRIQAGGLTAAELEKAITKRLEDLLNQPHVSIDVVEQRSQPVNVMGAVKAPGVHQLRGSRTLMEVLSLAGGVEADAGYRVRIARRVEQGQLPLAGAQQDATGALTVGEVNLEELMSGRHAAAGLIVKPHDTITVPRARMVYVIGEVRKPGGYVLREKESVSVLHVLSLAEGLTRTAGPGNARVLRPNPAGGQRHEIAVNLGKVLDGKAADVPLEPDDILFVPNSAARSGAVRALEAAIQMGTGIAIWRR